MGYNTTVVVHNDALHEIEHDPDFGKKLVDAISQLSGRRTGGIDVPAGCHANAARAIETHHADQSALVLVGGNYGSVVGTTFGWKHHEREDQLELMKKILGDMGYSIVKKRQGTPAHA